MRTSAGSPCSASSHLPSSATRRPNCSTNSSTLSSSSRSSVAAPLGREFGAARLADNELRREDHDPALLRGATVDPIHEQLRGDSTECLGRLGHHRQEWPQDGDVLNIVERDQRDILGHRQAVLTNRPHGARRGQIVNGKDRRWAGFKSEQRLHGPVTAGQVDRRLAQQLWLEPHPSRLQRLLVATPPVARGRDGRRLGNNGYPAVPKGNEMLDEPTRAADAVALDDVTLDAAHGTVDEHKRGAVALET